MLDLIHILNRLTTAGFDLLWWPLRSLPPFWSMTAVSCVAGVAMLWLFGKVSNQAAIKSARSQIQANLLAVRLFQDDLGVFFRIQARIFTHLGRYILHSLLPMLILFVPVLFLLAQLNLRYASRPFKPGETGLLEVTVKPNTPLGSIALQPDSGIAVEAGPVRVGEKHTVSWRIRAQEPGRHSVRVTLGTEKETLEHVVLVGPAIAATPSLRTRLSAVDLLLYPGAAPIPDSASIEELRVQYPEQQIKFLGMQISWVVLFLVASLLFGFACKGPLKVEI